MSLFSRSSFALQCSVPRLTHFYARSHEVLGKPTRTRESTILPKTTQLYTISRQPRKGVSRENLKIFSPTPSILHPHSGSRANPSPPPTPAPSPPSTRSPKPRKPLILLAIVGPVPNFWGMGNGERNRPLRGFATHGEANTPSEASAEGTG